MPVRVLAPLAFILSLAAGPALAGQCPLPPDASARQGAALGGVIAAALSATVQVEVGGEPADFADSAVTAAPPKAASGRPGQISGNRGGAGFIFDPTGLIATNAHVVAQARSVTVRLHDGRRLPARVVGLDTVMDLAVLKVEAGAPLPTAQLGDSETAREGDGVWAIGAPMGYGFSVSSGVVSGRDRFYDETFPVRLLQHDAALNPGNSGGPLFDTRGRVIGINTATPPETLFSIGVGLAIPTETARPILERLAREGRIQRGQLGLSVTAADAEVAAALGARQPGLLIDGLTDNGPARLGGLQVGDLVVAVGGAALSTPRDLAAALLNTRPDQQLEIVYVREGATQTAQVALEAAPSAPLPLAAQTVIDAPLDPGLTFGPSTWNGGVAVRTVRPDGPAARYGLRPGDRLRSVNGRVPADPAEALQLMRIGEAPVALLRVERAGQAARHVVLPLTRAAMDARPPGRVADAVFGLF